MLRDMEMKKNRLQAMNLSRLKLEESKIRHEVKEDSFEKKQLT